MSMSWLSNYNCCSSSLSLSCSFARRYSAGLQATLRRFLLDEHVQQTNFYVIQMFGMNVAYICYYTYLQHTIRVIHWKQNNNNKKVWFEFDSYTYIRFCHFVTWCKHSQWVKRFIFFYWWFELISFLPQSKIKLYAFSSTPKLIVDNSFSIPVAKPLRRLCYADTIMKAKFCSISQWQFWTRIKSKSLIFQ